MYSGFDSFYRIDFQATLSAVSFLFNPFHATGLFLYPLKASENL